MNIWIVPAGYKTGIEEVAPKVYAYIQAYGELGVSNAGLLLDKDGAMAVDALMVPSMTRRFLSAITKVTKKPVTKLVNTHHHIDHSGGNFLFREAEIISHTYCREEIERTGMPVEFFQKRIPRFATEFPKLQLAVPEVTFEDRMVFYQAGREVELRHLGPAHTFGDAFVYLPKDKVLFAGDLAFYYVTPLAFQGHVGNWIKVADRILEMDVETIVPGHGPIGSKKELREMRTYLTLIRREAKKRFDAGMTAEQAARDVKLGIYARWREPERILPNIMRLYQEFSNELHQPLDVMKMFDGMRQLRAEWHGHGAGDPDMCCA
jgi:glyoxylase-like metal-dependent hydrolase (beta-lactamase superfamily II)